MFLDLVAFYIGFVADFFHLLKFCGEMKHRMRKFERKNMRKMKKQRKNQRNVGEGEEEIKEIPEEVEVVQKKIRKKREKYEEEEHEDTQIDREIEDLEMKLGLREGKSKNREKNWKKVKKHLVLDGLGADFYELLEGKIVEDDDQQSITPVSSPEIELIDSSEEILEKIPSKFENLSENSSESSESLQKKRKTSETSSIPLFTPQIACDLQRKLKGLLNRLSDQNIEPLTSQITDLYKSNSNISLNDALWEFLLETLNNNQVPTQLLAVYSVEIAGLSKKIGREISAFILDKLYSEKAALTLSKVSFWSYLYYFNVFSSDVIVGFIKFLLTTLDEEKVEFLITAFNLIGFSLRKKEPGLLKELIEMTADKCKNCEVTSTRMGYMIEFLTDIKNNKKKQNMAEERLKFLKNWLKNISKTTGVKDSQITAKWSDLGTANWRTLLTPSFTFANNKTKFSAEIETLAKAQHMTTDSRKHIFCLIMSSEDYMDAFSKLVSLKKMERDIVRVLITCCGQEGTYNKFYTLTSIQLCKNLNSYKYSFQYALWDQLKQFQDFSIRKISNVAKFFADMILNGAVNFSILKAMEFDDMNEHLSLFLRILLENIIIASSVQTVTQIFEKCAQGNKLKDFCEGVRMFMKIVLLAHPREGVLKEIGVENFKSRVKASRKALKIRT